MDVIVVDEEVDEAWDADERVEREDMIDRNSY